MSDYILLTGMEFYGHHGCSAAERERGQKYIVDAELALELSTAGKSDDLADTIDYVRVFEMIRAVVEGAPRNLIEAVAEDIARILLDTFPSLESIKITITKPSIEKIGLTAAASITRHA